MAADVQSVSGVSCSSQIVNEHPLDCRWVLWLLMDREGITWTEAQQQVHGPVASVEAFWRLLHHIHPPSSLCDADYSFFREGTTPAREDPHMRSGGRWILAMTTGGHQRARGYVMEAQFARLVDQLWKVVLLALIGEGFVSTGGSALVSGAVFSLRERAASSTSAKLALWLYSAGDSEEVQAIGQILVELLTFAASECDEPRGGWRLAFEDFQTHAVTLRI